MPVKPTKLLISKKDQQAFKKEGVVLAYLFGSHVYGYTHKDSDADIAVLFGKKVKDNQYFDKSLRLAGLLSDICPGREKTVTVLNEAPPLFRREVLAGGSLLYSTSEPARIDFQLKTVSGYEDTKHLRDLNYFYLKQRIQRGSF